MDGLVFYTYLDFEALAALALGGIASRSSDDLQMQVINTSATYQATTVVVSVDPTSPAAAAHQLFLSLDGDSFSSSVDVGTIAPGSGGARFWLRRVTPSTATGAFTANLLATPTAWSLPVDTSVSDNVGLDTDTELPDL